jgi:predicted ATPase
MIPRPLDRMFGRGAELAELQRRFDAGTALSTLLGPGGAGKTRLALEHGRQVEARGYEVIFCDLSACRSRRAVLSQLARELAAQEAGSEELARAVAARERVLLIIDNAEHVLSWVREVITACLAVSEGASLLVTSRHPLGLGGEATLDVGPLREPADVEALLLDRAVLARGKPPTGAPLAELIALLDGLPLAIELAAARLEVLSPTQLVERLRRQRTGLGKPALEERHRTLTACIAWSWELLSERERQAASALAELPGGFSVELAERLLTELGDDDPVERVHSLRSHSLLSPRAGQAGPRFGMLEAIRQFFLERAEHREHNQAILTRHMAELSAHWFSQCDRHEAERAFRELRDEHANLLRSLEVACADAGLQDFVPPLLRALERSALQTGSDAELWELAQSAADLATAPTARCQAALTAARGATRAGALEAAAALVAEASTLATSPIERARLALTAASLSYCQGHQLAEAERHARVARAASREAGDPLLEAEASSLFGVVLHVQGRISEAQAAYRDALDGVAGRSPRVEAVVRSHVGFLHYDLGNLDDAERELSHSLALHRDLGMERGIGRLEAVLGNLARSRGDGEEARELYARAIASRQRAGDRVYEAVYRMDRGILLALEAQYDDAARELADALAIARACGAQRIAALILGYLAVCRGHRDPEAAARDLEQAKALLEVEAGDPLSLFLRLHQAHLSALVGDAADAQRCVAEVEAQNAPMEHVRLAARLVRDALAQAAPPDDALLVALDTSWVRPPGGSWQDISRREAARRLLGALLEQRRRKPGAALDFEQLIALGWPGERLVESAAKNRLRVAIAFLRKLGLGEHLVQQQGGYVLAPTLRVIVARPPDAI